MKVLQQGRAQRAFTLIELIISIAILAILLGMAVPSFTELRLNTARRRAMDELWHAVFLARSEAIKRNSVIALCRSTDGVRCSDNNNWAAGWMVFENLDHDEPAERDADEPLLQRYDAWNNGTILSNRETFTFRPYTQGSVNGTLVFCDSRGSREARALIINHTGRPRISQKNASNQPLKCP